MRLRFILVKNDTCRVNTCGYTCHGSKGILSTVNATKLPSQIHQFYGDGFFLALNELNNCVHSSYVEVRVGSI